MHSINKNNSDTAAGSSAISNSQHVSGAYKKLWVASIGNLPLSASETEIRQLFSRYGKVHSVILLPQTEADRTNRYAWVMMERADKAVRELDETEFGSHKLQVKLMGLLFLDMATSTKNH